MNEFTASVKVNHVGVSVADLDAAGRFWIDGMGASEHGAFSWPVGTAPADESLATVDTAAEVLLLRTDCAFMEIFAFSSPTPRVRYSSAPGVRTLVWAAIDPYLTREAALQAGGGLASSGAQDEVVCPDGTPIRLVSAGDGPLGLVGVEVAVERAEAFAFHDVCGPVALTVRSGAEGPAAAAVDLGVNHICLDVSDAQAVRNHASSVAWHHQVTESSGGLAAVCYGTTVDGVLVELLESRSPEAFLARSRLVSP